MESMKPLLIFVCTSNTCRSPMAEGLSKKFNIDKLNNKYNIISRALTDAYEPENSIASLNSYETMKNDFNIDISNHRSKLLDDNDVNQAYKIIGVTQGHYNEIVKRYPNQINKVTKLQKDIPDPWHQSIEIYKKTAIIMNEQINDIMNKI